MKKNIKCLFLILFFFSFIFNSFSQELITTGKDTLIVISPKNLKTINSIIIERKYLKREINLMDSIISGKNNIIQDLYKIDSQKEIIIKAYKSDLDKKTKELSKEKKKSKLILLTSGVLIILATFL